MLPPKTVYCLHVSRNVKSKRNTPSHVSWYRKNLFMNYELRGIFNNKVINISGSATGLQDLPPPCT
jgi:hypothetical protein